MPVHPPRAYPPVIVPGWCREDDGVEIDVDTFDDEIDTSWTKGRPAQTFPAVSAGDVDEARTLQKRLLVEGHFIPYVDALYVTGSTRRLRSRRRRCGGQAQEAHPNSAGPWRTELCVFRDVALSFWP